MSAEDFLPQNITTQRSCFCVFEARPLHVRPSGQQQSLPFCPYRVFRLVCLFVFLFHKMSSDTERRGLKSVAVPRLVRSFVCGVELKLEGDPEMVTGCSFAAIWWPFCSSAVTLKSCLRVNPTGFDAGLLVVDTFYSYGGGCSSVGRAGYPLL